MEMEESRWSALIFLNLNMIDFIKQNIKTGMENTIVETSFPTAITRNS